MVNKQYHPGRSSKKKALNEVMAQMNVYDPWLSMDSRKTCLRDFFSSQRQQQGQ